MFKSELNLIELDGRPDLWRVAAPLIWETGGERITVPVGFITDLASIPHLFDWAPNLDRDGLSRRPAALHDALYALGRERGKDYADSTLRAALKAEGMGNLGAFEYWYAVHRMGQSSYNSDAHPQNGSNGFYTEADHVAYAGTLFSTI